MPEDLHQVDIDEAIGMALQPIEGMKLKEITGMRLGRDEVQDAIHRTKITTNGFKVIPTIQEVYDQLRKDEDE